ncbi:DUF5313 family protein [Gordonia insulae]|uniref:DUF5313 domain-containing protein n=1 Tax=Gordonia insulae TaxID=2420509 RepID=A0A3G8JVE9_9ACTN|nr:DUF5313 family protein [Gordonia insulae]AZG48552.1 hypothetical protein D7316_05169 [Gordonia insulae]
MSDTRPDLLQRLRYLAGTPLPESMREWVRHDVTGPGHLRRYLIRGVVPVIPILVVFAFIPGPPIVRICMILLLLLPLIYFQIALIKIYRRHLLLTNGLDPELLNSKRDKRRATTRSDYENIYRKP